MEDLRLSDMMKMQYELWEKNKDDWAPLEPAFGRNSMLWVVEEIGEAIAIIKKKGDAAIMNDSEVRARYIEELSDVLMFFSDMLVSYRISGEELSRAFITKHERNMRRDFRAEHERF